MSTPDRISTTGQVVLKSESFENNAASGDGTTRIYTGSRANMAAQRMVEAAFGASLLRLEPTGDGNYQLTAGYTWDTSKGGNAQAPINSHELENSMNQVDVFCNDNFRETFLTVFGSQAGALVAMNWLQQLITWGEQQSGKDSPPSTISDAINTSVNASAYSTEQKALVLNACRGILFHQVKNSIQFDSIYRRRITAASYNQVQAGFTGAGKIWTTAEILAFENVPSSWWFQLPPTYLWLKAW